MKGIILKHNKNQSIILTPTGDFKEVYMRDHQQVHIGDEIEFHWYNTIIIKLLSWLTIKPAMAVSLAALLIAVLIPTYMMNQSSQVAGYVNIDINPSIQLTYNTNFKVVEIQSLNEDGKSLMNSLNLKKMSLEYAIEMVVSEAIANNFINNEKDNGIIITTTELKNTINTQLIEQRLLSQISGFRSISLIILSCNELDFEDALVQKQSPGELLIKRYIQSSSNKVLVNDETSTYELIKLYNEIDLNDTDVIDTEVNDQNKKSINSDDQNDSNNKDANQQKDNGDILDNEKSKIDNEEDSENQNIEDNKQDDSERENKDQEDKEDDSDKEATKEEDSDREDAKEDDSDSEATKEDDSDREATKEEDSDREDTKEDDSDSEGTKEDDSDRKDTHQEDTEYEDATREDTEDVKHIMIVPADEDSVLEDTVHEDTVHEDTVHEDSEHEDNEHPDYTEESEEPEEP